MSKNTQTHVWVVEMFSKTDKVWLPCAQAALARSDARRVMNFEWRHNYPDEKFRVVKYVRAA